MMRRAKCQVGDKEVDIEIRMCFEGWSGETEFFGVEIKS